MSPALDAARGPFMPLAVLAVALLAAAAELVRQRRGAAARAELVVRACHEVRGPLAAAHLALHALQRRGVSVTAVEDELWRAARALSDLAVASAGETAADRPEPVDLGALLRRQTAGWQGAARARGCELVLSPPAPGLVVHADRLRLAQASANLVANALEHGGSRVDVAVWAADGRVVLEVTDDGPGLPAPVATLTARARAGRGQRGRGLAIVQEIAARHGGSIATAPAARGARLVFDLPAWQPARHAAEAQGR